MRYLTIWRVKPGRTPFRLATDRFWPILNNMSDHPLIRLFINGTAIGLFLSALFVTLLWIGNVSGLRDMVQNSRDGLLALILIWVPTGLLFAAIQIGYAVHNLGPDD